jgi:hypothetical protein
MPHVGGTAKHHGVVEFHVVYVGYRVGLGRDTVRSKAGGDAFGDAGRRTMAGGIGNEDSHRTSWDEGNQAKGQMTRVCHFSGLGSVSGSLR